MIELLSLRRHKSTQLPDGRHQVCTSATLSRPCRPSSPLCPRNHEKQKHHNYVMNVAHTAFWLGVVSDLPGFHVSLFTPFVLCSWHPPNIPFWTRRIAQHPRHRSSWAQSRGPFRHVWTQVHRQNRLHGRSTDGTKPPRVDPRIFIRFSRLLGFRRYTKKT